MDKTKNKASAPGTEATVRLSYATAVCAMAGLESMLITLRQAQNKAANAKPLESKEAQEYRKISEFYALQHGNFLQAKEELSAEIEAHLKLKGKEVQP